MKYLYKLSGMSCQHCANTVEAALDEVPGVDAARADFNKSELEVVATEEVSIKELQKALPQQYQLSTY